jgi:hypothetical protein
MRVRAEEAMDGASLGLLMFCQGLLKRLLDRGLLDPSEVREDVDAAILLLEHQGTREPLLGP